MKVIEPTPSQAAVVMKNYLRSLGFEVTLANAQECFARSRGYADWNTLASQVGIRGKKAAVTSEAQVKEATPSDKKPQPMGPFAVFVNGGYYDTVVYYDQAMSMAEMFTVMEDEDRSEPFDCVTIEDALGNIVEKFIQSHTRIRIYGEDEGLLLSCANRSELNNELVSLIDGNEPFRVEEYTLKVDLGITGVTSSPEPELIYNSGPREAAVSTWKAIYVNGQPALREDGSPLTFEFLAEAKEWLSAQMRKSGAIIEMVLRPLQDLDNWEVAVPGYSGQVMLTRQSLQSGN